MLISWMTRRCGKGRGEGELKWQEREVVHLRAIGKQAPYSSGNHSARGGVIGTLCSSDRERQPDGALNPSSTRCIGWAHCDSRMQGILVPG